VCTRAQRSRLDAWRPGDRHPALSSDRKPHGAAPPSTWLKNAQSFPSEPRPLSEHVLYEECSAGHNVRVMNRMNDGARAGLSRREFGEAAAKAGIAAGAAIWVAPQLCSVALAQTTKGSPVPPTTAAPPTTTPPTTARPVPPSTALPGPPITGGAAPAAAPGAAGAPAGAAGGGAGAAAPGGGGALAFTGADPRKLAVTGGAALLTGSALIAADRRRAGPRPPLAIAVEDPIDEAAESRCARRV